jgi:hypothetical protein
VALLYNPTAYAPHFKRYEVDYFLYNLADGTLKSYFRKATLVKIIFSPNGAYICYFKDKKLVAVQYKTQSTVSIVPPTGSNGFQMI